MRWVHEFPTEPGHYWFVGERYGRNDYAKKHGDKAKIELALCDVKRIANGVLVVANGQIMYKEEVGEEWFFAPAQLPVDIPKFAKGSDLTRLNRGTS